MNILHRSVIVDHDPKTLFGLSERRTNCFVEMRFLRFKRWDADVDQMLLHGVIVPDADAISAAEISVY
jgi:hypothetical protein